MLTIVSLEENLDLVCWIPVGFWDIVLMLCTFIVSLTRQNVGMEPQTNLHQQKSSIQTNKSCGLWDFLETTSRRLENSE